MRSIILFLALTSSTIASSGMAETFSAYHVGNSLSCDMYIAFRKTATAYQASKGDTYSWGFHFRNGTGITWMYANPTPPPAANGKIDPTRSAVGQTAVSLWPDSNLVPWPKALPGNHWDVVTVQPFHDTQVSTDLATDKAAINGMIAAAKTRADNASTRFFIYAAWPAVKYGDLESYKNAYLATNMDGSMPTRKYITTLADSVRQTHPDVAVIPVGEVLYALDEMMKTGKFQNFTSIQQLHRDPIHLNSIGENVAAWTAYATIFKQSPVGLPNDTRANGLAAPFTNVTDVSPADLHLMQQTIWAVVNEQSKYTNVTERAKVDE